jgi:hypothetical protein
MLDFISCRSQNIGNIAGLKMGYLHRNTKFKGLKEKREKEGRKFISYFTANLPSIF